MKSILGTFKEHKHILVGFLGAALVFVLSLGNQLKKFTIMGESVGFDYFTWPRCGLAILNNTNIYTSSQDYVFGDHATNWISHPLLCALGIPLVFLEPWFGYYLVNFLYFVAHCFLIYAFGKKIKQKKALNYFFFFFLGFFFPWYVMYILGQYHAIVVLGVGLVLLGHINFGFLLSAFGKPILAPAALVLLQRQKFKNIVLIGTFFVVGTAPWFIYWQNGFHISKNFNQFIQGSSTFLKYVVLHWSQETSLAKILSEFLPQDVNLIVRSVLTGSFLLWVLFKLRKKEIELAIAMSVLWYFFLYARGHEYHFSLFVPLFAYLYTFERYQTKTLFFLLLVAALPTVFYYFSFHNSEAGRLSFVELKEINSFFFWLFMLHKPLLAPLLWSYVIFIESQKEKRFPLLAASRSRV